MTKLHLEYETTHAGGEPLSKGDWPDRSDTVVTFKPTGIFLSTEDKQTWRNEDIESDEDVKSGDTVFLVVVRYQDGDTFGRSIGNYSFWGVYKNVQRAKKLKELIREDAYSQVDNEDKIMALATHRWRSVYDWRGFFNRLENVEIHVMTVI